jgi:hypothetical protein
MTGVVVPVATDTGAVPVTLVTDPEPLLLKVFQLNGAQVLLFLQISQWM